MRSRLHTLARLVRGSIDARRERATRGAPSVRPPFSDDARPSRAADADALGISGDALAPTSEQVVEQSRLDALALETKLAAVAASAPGALYSFRLAPDGVQSCPYASPSIRSIFGVGPEELVGDASKIFAVIAAEDTARVAAAIGRSAQTLEPFHEDFRVMHPVKGRIWVTASSIPIRELDGGVLWHGIVYDVSDRVLATRALASSESRFRSYVEHAPDAVCVLGHDGALIDLNPAALRMTGYDADALRGRQLVQLVPPVARPRFTDDLTRLAAGEVIDAEYPLETLAGQSIAVAMRAVPLADGTSLAFVRDVTAQRRADEAARENAARLRGIVESAMDGIIAVDELQRIVLVNPAAEAMFGYHADELVGQPLGVLIPDGARDRHAAAVSSFADEGRTRRQPHALGELEGKRADGERFPAEISISRIHVGDRKLATAIVRDVTGRHRAEAALSASDERFRQLAESIREVFWLIDAASEQVIYVSPAYETVWGRSCESLYAAPRSWVDAIHEQDRAAVVAKVPRFVEGPLEFEYRVVRPDGSIRWVRDQSFPVHGPEGRVIRIAGVAEDITARRQLEEELRQAQKLESVGLLAGGIAHDFNNLLTVIAGNSEMLLADLPSEGLARELAVEIQRAGERAASLTRQLLAFSRRQVLEPKVLDLDAVVLDTEKILRRLLGEDILLEERLASSTERVHLDPGHLVQVILNLAVNARDAMPKGGRLRITTAVVEIDGTHGPVLATATPGRYVMLSMTDSGCGMSPELLERIFEPFFTTKGPGRGTGMGLAVVHGIVQQSGGHLEVESQPGVGSTFRMYFPTVDAAAPTRPSALARDALHGSETVLLVEDEESVRRLGERVLESAGYVVIGAGNATQALERIAELGRPIDLLVTDVVMPGLGGRELADRLRESHPALRVLFTSGYTDDAVVRHGVRHSEVWFLQKPYAPFVFLRKIREVLDAR